MSSVNSKIFRAYDIRGIYPKEINEKTAHQIGKAFAIYLKENEKVFLPGISRGEKKIIVGQDARLSSHALSSSFISGVIGQGINVWDIGLVTVDALCFASGYFHFPAVMITASHNPKEWNGFKLMKSDVEFFNVGDLETIINLGASKNKTSVKKGTLTQENIKKYYIKHILSFINIATIRPMRIAIDTGNGAVGPILEPILKKLPLEYTAMNFNPDGNFPHHGPDPTDEKNLVDLINRVKSGHYHFGCAFDGDGDRIIFVDENGELVPSSTVSALMSKYFLFQTRGEKVVYDAITSKIVPEIIEMYNGEAIRERVGNIFISRRLKEIGGIFGAEKSGHYFFRNNFYADSGIIGFLTMLNILSNEKKGLSVLAKKFSKYVSMPMINFKTSNPEDLIKKIAQNFEGYEIDWLDGLTVTTSDFWFNLRSSNTEPLVRLSVEAKDEIILNRVKKNLINLIKRENADY